LTTDTWDETAAIVKNMGVRLHRYEQNQGKGAALKSGFYLVLQDGLDTVITLDSDGQHDPEAIPAFISAHLLGAAKSSWITSSWKRETWWKVPSGAVPPSVTRTWI